MADTDTQGIPLGPGELEELDGAYDELPERVLQDFIGVVLESVPERSAQYNQAQFKVQMQPLNLSDDAKPRTNWYSGKTKASTLGSLKASLKALGFEWTSTTEVVLQLSGAVFHWTEQVINTGRKVKEGDEPTTRLLPVEFLGYDARTRAEAGEDMEGLDAYDRMAAA